MILSVELGCNRIVLSMGRERSNIPLISSAIPQHIKCLVYFQPSLRTTLGDNFWVSATIECDRVESNRRSVKNTSTDVSLLHWNTEWPCILYVIMNAK